MKEKYKKHRLLKRVGYLVFFVQIILFCSFLFFIFLHSNFFQNTVTQKYITSISKQIDYSIKVGKVEFSVFNTIYLENVRIKDKQDRMMVQVDKIILNFNYLSLLFLENEISFEQAILVHPKIRLYNNTTSLNISEFIFTIDSLINKENNINIFEKKNQFSKKISCQNIQIRNLDFKYQYLGKTYYQDRFDLNLFHFEDADIDIKDFSMYEEVTSAKIHIISAEEKKKKIKIHQMKTDYVFTPTYMLFDNLYLNFNRSTVKNYLKFSYKNISDIIYFNSRVNIDLKCNGTELYAEDIAKFIPTMNNYKDVYGLTGHLTGFFNDFKVMGLSVDFGNKSNMYGNASFKGMDYFQKLKMDISIKKADIDTKDFTQYLVFENETYLTNLKNLHGNINLKGEESNFHINSDVETKLGNLQLDMSFQPKINYYSGSIHGNDFLLNKWNPDLPMGTSTFSLKIKGIAADTIDIDFSSFIQKTIFSKTKLRNIYSRGKINSKKIQGMIEVKDPNILLSTNYQYNYIDKKSMVDGVIEIFNLKKIGYGKKQIYAKTNFEIEYQTDTMKNLSQGKVNIKNIYLKNKKDSVFIPSVLLEKKYKEDIISISSDLFDGFVKNSNEFKNIPDYLSDISNKFTFFLKEKKLEETHFDASKDFLHLNIKNVNPLVKIFSPSNIHLSKGKIDVYLHQREKQIELQVLLYLDTIKYNKVFFMGNTLSACFFKLQKEETYTIDVFANSEKQRIADVFFEKTYFNLSQSVFNKDNYIFKIEFTSDENKENNYGVFQGEIKKTISADSYQVFFDKFDLKIFNKLWNINNTSAIVFKKNKLVFHDLSFFNQSQELFLDGSVGGTIDTLFLKGKNISLDFFSLFIDRRCSGESNFELQFINKTQPIFIGKMDMTNLSLDTFKIGNVFLQSNWDPKKNEMYLSGVLHNQKNKNQFSLRGTYSYLKDRMDMKILFKETDLKLAKLFLNKDIIDLEGSLLGEIGVKGEIRKPIFEGDIFIKNGSIWLKSLNTRYEFSDKISLKQQSILLKNAKISDENKNQMLVNGDVKYEKDKIYFNMKGEMDNFLLLNTTQEENELFYGKIYLNGGISFYGNNENSDLYVNGSTQKGTYFNLSPSKNELYSQEDFIYFLSKKENKEKTNDKLKAINTSNINYTFDLEVTSDAFLQFIIDSKMGDAVNGYAKGNINISFDNQQTWNLYGALSILEGKYNFNFLNLINKEFDITNSSTISWSGNPEKALIDIKAKYPQRVSLLPLIPNNFQISDIPSEARQLYPVNVLLNLKGDLSDHPKFYFDIEFPQYPRNIITNTGILLPLDSYVEAFKQNIQLNSQELNKQIFSLIILKKLSKNTLFQDISATEAAQQSVSELLANQLSSWLTDIDKNLEIDINLNQWQEENIQDIQLRMSYFFFDKRLKFTRKGSIVNPNQSNWDIIGDITLEYLLLADGTLKMKLYNKRNELNSQLFLSTENQNMTGVSIMHLRNFMNFFPKKKKNNYLPPKE